MHIYMQNTQAENKKESERVSADLAWQYTATHLSDLEQQPLLFTHLSLNFHIIQKNTTISKARSEAGKW